MTVSKFSKSIGLIKIVALTFAIGLSSPIEGKTSRNGSFSLDHSIREKLVELSLKSEISANDLKLLITEFEILANDGLSCLPSEATESDYHARWDLESELLQDLEAWASNTDYSNLAPEKEEFDRIIQDPMVLSALIRADSHKSVDTRLFTFSMLRNRLSGAGNKLRKVEVLQDYFASSPRSLLSLRESDSNLPCYEALRTRIIAAKVAASRLFLELPSSITGLSGIGEYSYQSPLRTIYQGLPNNSLFDLNKSYLERRVSKVPDQKIKYRLDWIPLNHRAETSVVEGVVTYRLKTPLFVPPGIHEADNDVAIYAPEVRFHPNAVIQSSGNVVTINTAKIVAPWIDVSGADPLGRSGKPGGSIQIALNAPLYALIGSPLLIAMGSSGRWIECEQGQDVIPGNGGNGGFITVRGGPSRGLTSNFLNIPGENGGVYCNGNTLLGEPGAYHRPTIIGHEDL